MANYKELVTTNIKKLRLSLNLTQEKFAEKANISVEGYRAIEKSRNMPQPDTIDKICKAFKLTPFDLLLPDTSVDENLMEEISCKLKLCTANDLRKISQMIDLIRK